MFAPSFAFPRDMGCYARLFPFAQVVVLVPIIIIPLFFAVPAILFFGLWSPFSPDAALHRCSRPPSVSQPLGRSLLLPAWFPRISPNGLLGGSRRSSAALPANGELFDRMTFLNEGRQPRRLRAPACPRLPAGPAVLRRNLYALHRAWPPRSPERAAPPLAATAAQQCQLPLQIATPIRKRSFDIRPQRE
jgi:hypothetical protein